MVNAHRSLAARPVSATGSNRNRFWYTAREWDEETGLDYYRARYYDPASGRFISEDPIGFRGGINFYKYATNHPINLKDPSGKQTGFEEYVPADDGRTTTSVSAAAQTNAR